MCDSHKNPHASAKKARRGIALEHGAAHARDHQRWSRRSFLHLTGMAGLGSMLIGKLPVFAAGSLSLNAALTQAPGDRVLVLIRLKGGNDGLNTIVPLYDYDTYANLRPTLRIPESDAITLTDEAALAPWLSDLYSLWGEGQMRVVQGVGYPDQNLSHFRSSDIWATASDADEQLHSGWLGRYFDGLYPDFLFNPPPQPPAIQIGSLGSLTFLNADNVSLAMAVTDPDQLFELAQTGQMYDLNDLPDCHYGAQLGYVRAVANSTFIYAEAIKTAWEASSTQATYDDTPLGQQLALVARLIKGNLGARVYMVELDGFDTHANQPDWHPQLLTDLGKSVRAFFDDLEAGGWHDKVLAMTHSEFGRRPEENGSSGTDHGAAAPLMLFGPGLNGHGLAGTAPSLTDLDDAGNLKFHTDFRSVYATVLEYWLCVDGATVDNVLGYPFERLYELGLDCAVTATTQPAATAALRHRAVPQGDGSFLVEFELPRAGQVRLSVHDLLGRRLETREGWFGAGSQQVRIMTSAPRIAAAAYVYTIHYEGRTWSGKLARVR